MSIFEKRYIFTSNRHSKPGMMALMFGMMSLISLFLAVGFSIKNAGENALRMGGAGFLAIIFALVGSVLGIMSLRESDVFPTLPKIGFGISLISLLLWIGVIYAGISGIGQL
ncbi:MAG: hypothetical protein IJT24_07390 [Lachnospiraceae bacterium]|nr:hypothetical protein [Lachnospiraceae bacterium]